MKCHICKGGGVFDLIHHNLKVCESCFLKFFKRKVEKTIKNLKLFDKKDKLLIAISGGKDSMGLWNLLCELGYEVDGIYMDMGFGEYSLKAKEKVEKLGNKLSKKLHIINFKEKEKFSLKDFLKYTNRAPCSLCGLVKRYHLNEFALKKGYDVLITGHNLDDEASVLLKNVLHWELEYLGRQAPFLEAMEGFVKKVKPYIFCYEKETLIYALISKLDYLREKCPYSENSKNRRLKMALHLLEDSTPGIKLNFMKIFLKKRHFFTPLRERELRELVKSCKLCKYPTDREICALCTIRERIKYESSNCK